MYSGQTALGGVWRGALPHTESALCRVLNVSLELQKKRMPHFRLHESLTPIIKKYIGESFHILD